MATVHMIHGYLGAGKTTFARQLERRLPALRLTHDEWILRLYGEDPPPSEFQACFERVSERIAAVWTRCVELGLDVVLDLGFWSRAHASPHFASMMETVGGFATVRAGLSDGRVVTSG